MSYAPKFSGRALCRAQVGCGRICCADLFDLSDEGGGTAIVSSTAVRCNLMSALADACVLEVATRVDVERIDVATDRRSRRGILP